jgi:hypothetical protein
MGQGRSVRSSLQRAHEKERDLGDPAPFPTAQTTCETRNASAFRVSRIVADLNRSGGGIRTNRLALSMMFRFLFQNDSVIYALQQVVSC